MCFPKRMGSRPATQIRICDRNCRASTDLRRIEPSRATRSQPRVRLRRKPPSDFELPINRAFEEPAQFLAALVEKLARSIFFAKASGVAPGFGVRLVG